MSPPAFGQSKLNEAPIMMRRTKIPALCLMLAVVVLGACASGPPAAKLKWTDLTDLAPGNKTRSVTKEIKGTSAVTGAAVDETIVTQYPDSDDGRACTKQCDHVFSHACLGQYEARDCTGKYQQCAQGCGATVTVHGAATR